MTKTFGRSTLFVVSMLTWAALQLFPVLSPMAFADEPKVEIGLPSLQQVFRRFSDPKVPIQPFSNKTVKEEGEHQSFGLSIPGSQGFINAGERYRPRVLVSGYPLIRAKGMVKGNGVLYVADSGKNGGNKEAARIWQFDPFKKELKVFYKGPLLEHSKWLYYLAGTGGEPDQLIISDYGVEPAPRIAGTGEGAKVLSIPVNRDNSPGMPRVIYEGAQSWPGMSEQLRLIDKWTPAGFALSV